MSKPMQKSKVKIIDMHIYPTDKAKKYVNSNAEFEIYITSHAYKRMLQRFGDTYEKYAKHDESKRQFLQRSACEACAKLLKRNHPLTNKNRGETIYNDFIWIFSFDRDVPILVTLHHYKPNPEYIKK